MGSKKAEKKVKSVAEYKEKSLRKIKKLARKSDTTIIQLELPDSVADEVRDATNRAIAEAISKLTKPLNSTVSLVNGDGEVVEFPSHSKPTIQASSRREPRHSSYDISVVDLPLKSPACKGCPALANGTCKCAIKRLQKTA